MTGQRIKQTDQSFHLSQGTEPKVTDEDLAHQEYLAVWCDADGDERDPSPKPQRLDYNREVSGYREFKAHLADWEFEDQARLERAIQNKRQIWLEGYDQRHRQLVTIEQTIRVKGTLSQDLMSAARAVFEWLRERFLAARNTLGEAHEFTKHIEANWKITLGATRATQDHILKTDQEAEQALIQKTRPIEETAQQLWREVEEKREAYKAAAPKRKPPPPSFSGPSM